MPYKIIKRNNRYSVVKRENGRYKQLHSYDSKEKALRYLRALYANVPDARKGRRRKK